MHFLAFLKISQKSFSRVDDILITTGNFLHDVIANIGEYWENDNVMHYEDH